MFLTLLIVTFLIAGAVSFIVVKLFDNSINKILIRIIKDDISNAWSRYLKFAIFVVGISGGVRIWQLEQYIQPYPEGQRFILNGDRWVLEVYRTIIETLQSVAWLLLVFFVIALIAYVIVRGQEYKRENTLKQENK
ncbi:MAG: hypothetical protein R6W90_14450 [Ignavibacteriaceae bacterium]